MLKSPHHLAKQAEEAEGEGLLPLGEAPPTTKRMTET